MKHIRPVEELGRDLVSVLNPIRYLGGEFGQVVKDSADLTFALAFPDLYEIAMSNLAIKIIYDGLNRLDGVRCERVFAPAPDFEALLKKRGLPLYTLESGIPLCETDVIGVSIGYEPGITGLLAILDTGNVPLTCSERGEGDPIVIAGGCGVTNPAPLAKFIDAFFIGEAEAGLFDFVADLARMKKAGASRSALLERIASHPSVWTEAKAKAAGPGKVCARRAIHDGFSGDANGAFFFPLPNMRIVHDHGSVEIMRGCPNGCRFCHAGMFYRPQRMRSIDKICGDVERLVSVGGYREISLMSLSSGDYRGIDSLLSALSDRFSSRNVSFQLPSIKVNSFTLPLLEKMSEIRKSGLTFAIETPVDAWQLALNKEVYRDRIVEILLEAKRRGWSQAKFYFMIGLPVEKGGLLEETEIVNFLLDVQNRTRMQCNANIGTFIPKPHTPYQWSPQLTLEETERKLSVIHRSLPKGRFKVSSPRPFNSFVEGMMSRGDERVGDIILDAYRRGCRLDAWDDWARPDLWKEAIAAAGWDVAGETLRERSLDEDLPWDGVNLGASKAFLRREKLKSDAQELTSACSSSCGDPCGVCGTKRSVEVIDPPVPVVPEESAVSANIVNPANPVQAFEVTNSKPRPSGPEAVQRVIMEFSKDGEAAYIPHLALVEIWNKAFQRSGLPVIYTEGFNPLPRFELAQSLSLGIGSGCEISSFMLSEELSTDEIESELEKTLPRGLRVTRVFAYYLSRNVRREALSKYLWGNTYRYTFYDEALRDKTVADARFTEFLSANESIRFTQADGATAAYEVTVPFSLDRKLRDLIAEICGIQALEAVAIRKIESLATLPGNTIPVNFFEVFASVADENTQSQGDQ